MSTVPEASRLLPPRPARTGAYPRELCQFGLPLRPTDQTIWQRTNGNKEYAVTAGTFFKGTGGSRQAYQELPSGKYARAALFYIFTLARLSGREEIPLGRTALGFLRQTGITKTGIAHREAQRQMMLVARANFTIHHRDVAPHEDMGDTEVEDFEGGQLSESGRLWLPGDGSVFGDKDAPITSHIKLTPYFRRMVEGAVPIPRDAWVHLMKGSKSAMPLDVYVWLCARLWGMEKETRVTWEQLRGQFGSASTMKDFRRTFRQSVEVVQEVWPESKGYFFEVSGKTRRTGFHGWKLRAGAPEPIASDALIHLSKTSS